MNRKRIIAFLLACMLCLIELVGCGRDDQESSGIMVPEERIDENVLLETSIDETFIEETFIIENLIYEDEIYEYVIDENIICEAYTFEIVVGSTTEEEILAQLPDEFDEYEIDWPKVIGKFAVGTTVIIATGVVQYFVNSTYFIVASPITVAKEAMVGGALEATLRVVIQADKDGKDAERAVKKYAIEGFADGYMWGAIGSVLSITHKNYKRPKKLKNLSGEVLEIAIDGTVKDAAGKVLGKAYYGKKGIYLLRETIDAATLELFDTAGKQIVNVTAEQAVQISKGALPPNTILSLGRDATASICKTDALGNIFIVDGELLPNIEYRLGEYMYETDAYGRISEVAFDDLQLKEAGRARKPIINTPSEIGRGFERATDHRGHLIGDRFDGDNSLANIVPMDSTLNLGEYKEMEALWEESIEAGNHVNGSIKISYMGESFRPDSFEVIYDIGEGLVEKFFSNL